MSRTYIKAIEIKKVRYIKEVTIFVSENEPRHLIITGKNGSGKTSLLEAICDNLNYIVSEQYEDCASIRNSISHYEKRMEELGESEQEKKKKEEFLRYIEMYERKLRNWIDGVVLDTTSNMDLRQRYTEGKYILGYYRANRVLETEKYKNIEKVELKNVYSIGEKPGTKMTKYMVDLKARQAFSEEDSFDRKEIDCWFENLERLLKEIFNDDSIKLLFDKNTFQFSIHQDGKDDFDFNTLSSGYAAVFDIIGDLIMRMEAESQVRNTFEMEGIVLIDEVETHLHIELQKSILRILTTFFPNIQFVVTTHSPYILNSIENAKVYDLEKKLS